jgi:peptidyl-prolyl cis-trans isomerase SurA
MSSAPLNTLLCWMTVSSLGLAGLGTSVSAQTSPTPAQPSASQVAPPTAQPAPAGFPSFNSVFARPQGAPGAPSAAAPPGVPVTGVPVTGERPATPVPPVTLQAPTAAPAPEEPGKAKPTAPAKAARPKSDQPDKPKAPVRTAARTGVDPVVAKASETRGIGIAVLVNDDPITGYEIDQRQRFMGLSANVGERAQANFKRALADPSVSERLKAILGEVIKANQGKTREQIIAIFEERKKQFALNLQKQAVESARSAVLPGLRKNALDELVDERLKLQEAKRLGITVTDEEVSQIVRSIAEKNKMTEEQFAKHLNGMGADIEAMRGRFKATLAWNQVIKRKFGHQIAISERDVERMVSKGPAGDDQMELQLRRITLPVPGKLVQKAIDQRVAEAEALRAKFKDCGSLQALAGSVTNAKFEDLGSRKAGSIGEPTRSFLINAKDGEMVPPTVGAGGVELYAVCGRQVVKADDQKRNAAMEELRQKEFELFAKRHLRVLRDEASIGPPLADRQRPPG